MHIFKKFYRSENGSVLLLVGFLIAALIGILTLAIDASRTQSGSVNNQGAIDSTALAVTQYVVTYRMTTNRNDQPADVMAYAKKVYQQNLMMDQADAQMSDVDFELDFSDPEVVNVHACVLVDTPFAAALQNTRANKVCNSARASVPVFSNTEIVFALDVSTSMLDNYTADGSSTQKLAALQSSVNTILDTYGSVRSIFWGVVPYTGVVDLGTNAYNIVNNDKTSGTNPPGTDQSEGPGFSYIEETKYARSGAGAVFYWTPSTQDKPFNKLVYRNNNPPTDAISQLIRFPLTARQSGNISFEDDSAPTPGNMFQAYWHHPYDFYMKWNYTNSDSCGQCTQGTVTSTTFYYSDGSEHTGAPPECYTPPSSCTGPSCLPIGSN